MALEYRSMTTARYWSSPVFLDTRLSTFLLKQHRDFIPDSWMFSLTIVVRFLQLAGWSPLPNQSVVSTLVWPKSWLTWQTGTPLVIKGDPKVRLSILKSKNESWNIRLHIVYAVIRKETEKIKTSYKSWSDSGRQTSKVAEYIEAKMVHPRWFPAE